MSSKGGAGGRAGGPPGRSDHRSSRVRADESERTKRIGRSDRADSEHTSAQSDPFVDPDVTGDELDQEILEELKGLRGGLARVVARHLVMAGTLLDDDPQGAYGHAMAARRRATRLAAVREAAGVAAYAAGYYSEALAELRAVRRMTGDARQLPMIADCERGMGRPRRALELSTDPAVATLSAADRTEMIIVAAGARRDLGELDAAVVSLQVPELKETSGELWSLRLRYAYADALEAAGRRQEARSWFARVADADPAGETDAAERVTILDEQ